MAPLERLTAWCLPLVRDGGVLLAIKGRSAAEELAQAQDALRALGAARWRVCEVGADLLDEPTTLVEVHKARAEASGRARPGKVRSPRSRRG